MTLFGMLQTAARRLRLELTSENDLGHGCWQASFGGGREDEGSLSRAVASVIAE